MKDILFDTQSRELTFSKTKDNSAVRNVIWGKLMPNDNDSMPYMNVILPNEEADTVIHDEFTINVKASYYPLPSIIAVRFVVDEGGSYSLISINGKSSFAAKSCFRNFLVFEDIKACQLPIVNIHGEYTLHYKDGAVHIYSLGYSDIAVGESALQETSLINICAPGNLYRFPTTGIDAHLYINSVPAHTNLGKKLTVQYENDKKVINAADFDVETGQLLVDFGVEEADVDVEVERKENLNTEIVFVSENDIREDVNISLVNQPPEVM